MSPLQQRKQDNSILLRAELAHGVLVHRPGRTLLTLNHSDYCNLRCVMCPRHHAQGTHRLDAAVLERVRDRLIPGKALQYEAKLDVVTNGVVLTPEANHRARVAFDHLNVSRGSHVPAIDEHIRQPTKSARVHANLVAIGAERRAHPDDVLWSLSAVVMRANLEHLAEFVA